MNYNIIVFFIDLKGVCLRTPSQNKFNMFKLIKNKIKEIFRTK